MLEILRRPYVTWRLLASLYRICFPGGFLVAGVWLLVASWGAPEAIAQLARVGPYVVFAVALLLAWWFRQHRLTVAILVFALAERVLALLPQLELDRAVAELSAAMVALLGLDLLWLPLLRGRGRVTWRSSTGVVVVLVQAVLIALLLSSAAGRAQQRIVASIQSLPWDASSAALLLLGMATAVALLRAVLGSAAERGLFWASAAALLAASTDGEARTIYFSAAGFVVLLAILESSYQMAYEDELTALPSRRALNEALEDLGEVYSLALVDIDRFKQVNDRHGHDVGDQVLQAVATRLRRVGGGGRGYRYGGEEFALVFSELLAADAVPHLEALRQGIGAARFTLREPGRPRRKPKRPRRKKRKRPRSISVTVSIGVAQPSARRPDPQSVLEAADQALYRAKRGGRNQVRK